MSNQRDRARVTRSSGNVFADLGLSDADEALAKADIARQIARIIERRGWTQTRAAEALGIDQGSVSKLVRGHLEPFSTERLLRFLTLLDQDIEIVVRPTPASRQHAGLRVRIEDDPLPIAATSVRKGGIQA
jgi:predicted XRE-type DNA-binding protein